MTHVCSHCRKEIPEGEQRVTVDCGILCRDCAEKCTDHCDDCGKIFRIDHLTFVDGNAARHVCEYCLSSNYTLCDHCGKYYANKFISSFLVLHGRYACICNDCEVDHVFGCEVCGDLFYDPEQDMFCHDGLYRCLECQKDYEEDRIIHDYCYKPKPEFLPEKCSGRYYMGIELEVDSPDHEQSVAELQCHAEEVRDILGYVYMKDDASIDNGFEIVTHPALFEYHTLTMREKWVNAMQYLVDHGLHSHDTDTCGLHVHVSTRPLEQRDPAIVSKLLYIFTAYWDFFVKFSRRTPEKLHRWARRYPIAHVDAKDMPYLKTLAKGDFTRYMSINLKNDDTIEFRIFRGTLNPNTFFATLQLLQVIIERLIASTCQQIQQMRWTELVASDYPELNAYLEQHGLNKDIL